MSIMVENKIKDMKNTLKELIDERVITQYGSVVKSYIGWHRLPSDIEKVLDDEGYRLESEWDEDRGMYYYYK